MQNASGLRKARDATAKDPPATSPTPSVAPLLQDVFYPFAKHSLCSHSTTFSWNGCGGFLQGSSMVSRSGSGM
jgi:hypothetical protein